MTTERYSLLCRMTPEAGRVLRLTARRLGLSRSAAVEALIRLYGPGLSGITPGLRAALYGRSDGRLRRRVVRDGL